MTMWRLVVSDDWGPAFGADAEPKSAPPKKTPRQDSLFGLTTYFSELLPKDAWGKLNSPVNFPAMSKGLKKLREANYTPKQIRDMMHIFITEIKQKPLTEGVAPWRAFLANLDALAKKATTYKEPDSYDDVETDRRL
jgi:hypothetical protein